MSAGGIRYRDSSRLVMAFFVIVLFAAPYANITQNVNVISTRSESYSDTLIQPPDQSCDSSESLEIPLDYETPVSFELNSSVEQLSYTIDIEEPGFLTLNWSFEVIDASLSGLNFEFRVNESADRYVPQLGSYVSDELMQSPLGYWYEVMTGYSYQEETEIFAVNPGYIDLSFILTWLHADDKVNGTLEATWEYSFGSLPPATTSSNFTLEWDSDNSWEGALLNIPEDGLYDIRLDSYLSYNVSSGYAGPLDIHIPDKLIFLSKAKGALYASGLSNFIEYHPVHFVSIGSEADSYWFDEGMAAFQKGQYYVFGLSGIFEHLNSTSFNITIDVQPSVSLQLNANEPINLEFDALVPSTHLVAVILPDGNKSSLRFTNPSGGNWTVSTSFYPSMQPAAPSLTYLKYPEGEQTMEVRFDDIFVLTGIGVSVGTSFKAKQVTGEPWSVIYQPYGFTSSYTDGELTSYSMSYLYMTFPFPIFFFEVSAAPVAATYSETFNVTMCLDAVPFIELDETITTTSFNATHGPIIELYRFDVQSGHTYNISATPTEYTIEGTIVFAVLPSLSVFDQWSISYEPLLAKTVSDYPSYGYLAAQTTNRTASIEFLAAIDGEIQIYAAAGSGLSLGDCTEAEFEVEETPPTTIGFGDSVSLSTEETDLYGYQVELIEGYEYELTIQMFPSVGSVSATFFDTDGVNPFATTEEEIWLEVDSSTYLYKKFTLISHYTGIASLGLILEGDATLTWDVVDTTPPVLSIISPLDGSRFEPGTITIEFTADDNIELTQLNLTIGGSNIPLDLTATSYDWNAETEGVFVVKLTAEDTHGNTAGTHVVVIVALESYLSMEILVISGLGAFGGVLVIGIVVIRRRGGG